MSDGGLQVDISMCCVISLLAGCGDLFCLLVSKATSQLCCGVSRHLIFLLIPLACEATSTFVGRHVLCLLVYPSTSQFVVSVRVPSLVNFCSCWVASRLSNMVCLLVSEVTC